MTIGLLIVLVLIVAGFLLERGRERSAVAEERLWWMRERASLLNRVNPMTAQTVPEPVGDGELPQPAADSDEWWANFQERFTTTSARLKTASDD